MLFDSVDAIRQRNELRQRAIDRKLKEPEFINNSFDLELEVLERFERLYELNPQVPYFDLKHSNTFPSDMKTHTGIDLDRGKTYIFIQQKDVELVKWFSNECFSTPISAIKSEYYLKNGYAYRVFENPLYEQEIFNYFSECKNEIVDFIYKHAVVLMALHEFAHASNSHVFLRNDRKDLPKEVLRGLEIQADIIAAIYYAHSLKEDEQYIDTIQKYIRISRTQLKVNSYYTSILLATLAAYISFRCTIRNNYYWIGNSDFALDGYGDHPMTEARMGVIIDVIINNLFPDLGTNENAYIHQLLRKMIEEFESFYCRNTVNADAFSKNRQPLKLIETEEGLEYIAKLRSAAERADEYLLPYKKYVFYKDECWKPYL